MSEWERQKAVCTYKNNIRNFIFDCLEMIVCESYCDEDVFRKGYETAMENVLEYIDEDIPYIIDHLKEKNKKILEAYGE